MVLENNFFAKRHWNLPTEIIQEVNIYTLQVNIVSVIGRKPQNSYARNPCIHNDKHWKNKELWKPKPI